MRAKKKTRRAKNTSVTGGVGGGGGCVAAEGTSEDEEARGRKKEGALGRARIGSAQDIGPRRLGEALEAHRGVYARVRSHTGGLREEETGRKAPSKRERSSNGTTNV